MFLFSNTIKQKKKNIFFTFLIFVGYFSFTEIINYIGEKKCSGIFLNQVDKGVNFKQFFFYQANIIELPSNFFCLGTVIESNVIYSGFGYILFSQIFLIFLIYVLRKIEYFNFFQKSLLILLYIFCIEYLFNYKTNLNLINYVSFWQTIVFLGIFYVYKK